MSDQKSSMGDLFMQRRAAASGSRNTPTTGFSSQAQGQQGGTSSQKKKSFADIQREQQIESSQGSGQYGGSRSGGGQQGQYGGRSGGGREQHPMDDVGRLVRPAAAASSNPRERDSGGGGGYTPSSSRGGSSHDRGDSGRRGEGSRGGASSRSDRDRDRGGGRNDYRASLPLEQGVIHTLLDKFGFIKCADRDKELFMHYSEYKGGHSDDLNIGDEVEFRVGKAEERGGRRGGGGGGGGGDADKWSAFDIRKLPEGTIYWEKEGEPGKRFKGVVDQIAREESQGRHRGGGMSRDRDRGSSSRSATSPAVDGLIRITTDEEGDTKSSTDEAALEIYYTPSDYTSSKPGHSRLDRKDVVEFTLVTKRRTGKKYARDISLLQSERDRAREEREAKMLEDASVERGIVIGNKGDFGFFRSASREEEVYFHVSHIILPESTEDDGDDAGQLTLKEGQEVEFYVVNESSGGGGGGKKGKKLSARKIKLLPKGSVEFEHVIAEGVTGTVSACPVGNLTDNPFGRRDDRRGDRGASSASGGAGSSEQPVDGKIRLQNPIFVSEDNQVSEVALRPEHYPGGTFAISRTGSETGCWIRPNDVLLFDVVQKVVDGKCYAMPTKFVTSPSLRSEEGENISENSTSVKPAIRLIEPSLCGRSEGVIRSIHDNYGFIHLAERSVDAYFPLFEVLPSEIQGDLARNNPNVYGNEGIQSKGGRVNVEVGMEVVFDLSLQMLTNASGGGAGGRGGRYGGKQNNRPSSQQEKESLRARRMQILPKGTVKEKISIASGVKAIVTKEDPKQPFVGTLELEDSVKVETAIQRHPLVAKLLHDVGEGTYGEEEVAFHDVLSERDAQDIISMVVNSRDDLEWRYVPESAAGDSHSRKLCISRKKASDDDMEESEPSAKSPNAIEASTTSESANETSDETEGTEGKNEGVAVVTAASEEATSTGAEKHDSHKKKNKKAKIVKLIRFDKFSFPDMSIGPVGVGDVMTCDIVQVRRSGAIIVENITVVERKERPVVVSDRKDVKENTSQRKSLSGFVTEVVPSRQFGFITAVDDQGSKTGEHVFFHFREVEQSASATEDVAQDGGGGSSSLGSRSRKPGGRNGDASIRKGDEVKFDAGPGKNGKLDATNISILPRGTLTIVTKAAENKSSPTCTGYILMEPSHTSFANTPSHVVFPSGPTSVAGAGGAGGRWANVRDEKSTANKSGANAKGEGVILLLSDPSHLFSPRPISVDSPTKRGSAAATAGEASPKNNDAASENKDTTASESNTETDVENNGAAGDHGETKEKDATTQSSAVGTHLRYKLSSMAYRSDGPRRGDLITFGKTRGAKLVKDIRIEKMAAATSVRGVLADIDRDNDTAVFIVSSLEEHNEEIRYDIKLTELVSCDKALLKDKEQMDGILHEGKIFGVCRTKDIFLASSIGRNSSGGSGGLKGERRKLNLTVKKELRGMGGQIMAQSRMVKGPDGTNGFVDGWTKRTSIHAAKNQEEEEEDDDTNDDGARSLSAAASEFVPNFSIAASGFESAGGDVEES